MVSYKKLYEDLLKDMQKSIEPVKEDYKCSICGNQILSVMGEYYCSNKECSYDKTPDEIFEIVAEHTNLERID